MPGSFLFAMLIGLFVLTPPVTKKSLAFKLNIAGILFLEIAAGIALYLTWIDTFNQFSIDKGYVANLATANGAFLLLSPFLSDAILLLRLTAVFGTATTPKRTQIAVFTPTALMKIVRLGLICAYIHDLYITLLNSSSQLDVQEGKGDLGQKFLLVEGILEVLDNTYVSGLFIYKLRANNGVKFKRYSSNPFENGLAQLQKLFIMALQNYFFPITLAIVALCLVFGGKTDVSKAAGSYVEVINCFVSVAGVVAATLWISGTNGGPSLPNSSAPKQHHYVINPPSFADEKTQQYSAGSATLQGSIGGKKNYFGSRPSTAADTYASPPATRDTPRDTRDAPRDALRDLPRDPNYQLRTINFGGAFPTATLNNILEDEDAYAEEHAQGYVPAISPVSRNKEADPDAGVSDSNFETTPRDSFLSSQTVQTTSPSLQSPQSTTSDTGLVKKPSSFSFGNMFKKDTSRPPTRTRAELSPDQQRREDEFRGRIPDPYRPSSLALRMRGGEGDLEKQAGVDADTTADTSDAIDSQSTWQGQSQAQAQSQLQSTLPAQSTHSTLFTYKRGSTGGGIGRMPQATNTKKGLFH